MTNPNFTRSVLLALCGIALLAAPARARLDETPEECATRYGASFGKIPGRVAANGEFMYLYDKTFVNLEGFRSTIRVRVEFRNGKAWYIRYSGHFKDRDCQDLMAHNLKDDSWSEPETYQGRTFWISKKSPKRHATVFHAGENLVLEVMTDDCAKALADQRVAQTKAVLGDTTAEPAKAAGPGAGTPADGNDKAAPPPSGNRGLDGF